MATIKDQEHLLSDNTTASSTPAAPATPTTPATAPVATLNRSLTRHRPGYARIPSVSFAEENFDEDRADGGSVPQHTLRSTTNESNHGLGIVGIPSPSRPPRSSLQQSPLRFSTARDTEETHKTTPEQYQSTPSTGGLSGETKFDESFDDFDTTYHGSKHHGAARSTTSLHSVNAPSMSVRSETGILPSRMTSDDHSSGQATGNVKRRVGGFVSIVILTLAIFSTIFSGIFIAIALKGPRWGRKVSNDGMLTPSSAATITSFFAKMIEMSFVTVIVAFVGQALARRAFKLENARGVTLAEMSMRTWIMQPGTLLTQWESVRYAGVTVLGLISLLAALLAILYTSAATTLVQPQLKYSPWELMQLQGLVKTQFANPEYIGQACKTPITESYDEEYSATTCLQLEHVAMAFHNYYGYLSTWHYMTRNGTGSNVPEARPKGFALFNDNTTITAPWIETWHSNVTTYNTTVPRYINNFTMAMPHVGVIQAAIDPINQLMQPGDVDGATYSIIASVPSAAVNVLCATVVEEDLRPFVYELWPGSVPLNQSTWTPTYVYPDGYYPYLNGTTLDHIFGFGPEYGNMRTPPVFPKLPIDYNTIVNDTTGIPWGRSTIFLLGKGGPLDVAGNNVDQYYSLCQLQVGLTSNCSTRYNASSTGATLEAVCEDPDDSFAYIRSNPEALSGYSTVSPDWSNIGAQWIKSISLNDGAFDGNASNSRLLTQFMVTSPEYSTALPSMAEALAVMAGCTLIQSLADSPFQDTWSYTLPTVEPGHHQTFNASVRVQQYASGGVLDHQKLFHIVLFCVFLMNAIALIYFIAHGHWYTDFGEPTTLFSLAVTSPQSKQLIAGAGGFGPKGEQYKISWKINRDDTRYYIERQDLHTNAGSPGARRRRWTGRESWEMVSSPVHKLRSRFGS